MNPLAHKIQAAMRYRGFHDAAFNFLYRAEHLSHAELCRLAIAWNVR